MSGIAAIRLAASQLPEGISSPSAALFLLILLVLFIAGLAMLFLRRMVRPRGQKSDEEAAPGAPPSENEPAFAAASMQAVIQRLKEQERELERLHRQEKERAKQTERLTAAVTTNMPTGLLLVNVSGLITLANPAAERVLGLGALAYRRFSDVLGPQSALANLLADCLHNATTYQRGEVAHVTATGEGRTLGVTVSPIRAEPLANSSARPAGAICLLTDLTELTELQKQMRLRENLALLGELSAGIAHEFKNALATISGYAQILRSEALTPEQMDSVERILAESKMLAHIVSEFLGFARPIEIALGQVKTDGLVERVLQEARQAHPNVEFTPEGEFSDLAGDEALLRQALSNLLRNAAEAAQAATHEPGERPLVRLQGSLETRGRSQVQIIRVLDNGPGIAPADQPKLFLPFYTTKHGGTGLGLAVVQKIAVHHGGQVAARNHSGGGAEFILALPLQQPQITEAVDSASGRI
jgi:signal transduction histidine kinase